MGLIQDKMAGAGVTPPGQGVLPSGQGVQPSGQGVQPGQQPAPGAELEEPAGDITPIVAAAMKALYEAGAIEDVISIVQNAKFPAQGLADVTFDMLSSIDEKAGGNIPEELFGPAASEILGLIVEDAQKLGLEVGGRDIALATQILVLRILEEGGQDVSQMRASMNQVDFDKVGQMIDQQMAQGQGAQQ
jgi:hypothetical protein